MADMLVKLYELPPLAPQLALLRQQEVTLRRALAYEKGTVVKWVGKTFGAQWGAECDVSFARQPIACFIAENKGKLCGFSCFDSTAKNFFGPMGIAADARGSGIGKGLLLVTLNAMHTEGYAYAIIGGVGDQDGFYRKTVRATPIDGSSPGIYHKAVKE